MRHCANACAIIKRDNDPDGQGLADDSNGGGGGSATLKEQRAPSVARWSREERRSLRQGSKMHAIMVFSKGMVIRKQSRELPKGRLWVPYSSMCIQDSTGPRARVGHDKNTRCDGRV